MKLYEIEFVKLLPAFMHDDLAVKGLASGTDEIIKALEATKRIMSVWDNIGNLEESELDELAWELNVLWYDKSADLEAKRDIILNSDKVYQKLGTKWAVENVIRSYFGNGHVFEWFEYDGEPGHFKILSENPTITNDKYAEFLNILHKVKRASAILDGIQITITGQMQMYLGAALQTGVELSVYPIFNDELTASYTCPLLSYYKQGTQLSVYPKLEVK